MGVAGGEEVLLTTFLLTGDVVWIVGGRELGEWSVVEEDTVTLLVLLPESNWDLIASKFLPEKVLDTTDLWTLTLLTLELEKEELPEDAEVEPLFSKMEILSEMGLLPL